MAYSLKELLEKQNAQRAVPLPPPTQHTQNRVSAPVPPKDTDFSAVLGAARIEAEERRKREERETSMRERDEANLRKLEERELYQLDDDGGYVPYVESTPLALVSRSLVPYEPKEIYEDESDDSLVAWENDVWGDDDSDANDGDYDDIMGGVKVKPDPSQEHAVRVLSSVQYGCLIGAAGTGKTTTTRLLLNTLINGDAEYGIEPLRLSRVNLRAYQSSTAEAGEEGEAVRDLIPSIAFCAYTGQATQVLKSRMPGSWQKNVFTIHSLLGFYPEVYRGDDGKDKMRFVPYYTADNKMPWDVYFIDEASMVSVELWHMMLDAMKPGARVYMIGDLNQLPPPVGQGILGFALAKWTVCELTHVHRQSNDAENIIVDNAHLVLRGKPIQFQDPKLVPDWRVIGFRLDHDTTKAYQQIVALCKGLADKTMPDGDKVYDPWRDRVMTAMNGFDGNSTASLVGQHPINEALSQIFADPAHPRIVIDAKMSMKHFAVGYRVMATKNESPAEVNRVTNGMTGIILEIKENLKWFGDRRLVGEENVVAENRRAMVKEALAKGGQTALDRANEISHQMDDFDIDWSGQESNQSEERNGGPASHIVTVRFDNGGVRNYSMNAQIDQLRIAYASTTHKAQGAEFPTAIIVVHHASRQMLCRENLYTAFTRASRRVIVLYSDYGLRIALATQKITGITLPEKLRQYERLMGGEGGKSGFKIMNVRLGEED